MALERKDIMSYVLLKPWLEKLGYNDETISLLDHSPAENDFHKLYGSSELYEFLKTHRGSEICIIGDYDCDGVTSTSILTLMLRKLGFDAKYYIPHRVEDGYGLSCGIIDKIADMYPRLKILLTCDNGIAAKDAVDYAKSKGYKVIVTDHHRINKDVYPDQADIIVHPALGENPFANISGAQVAWKISQAVFEAFNIHDEELEEYFFQLMTVSIVSDVMPIGGTDINQLRVNENRELLRKGIKSLQEKPNWRWKHIFNGMNVDEHLDETTIGFYIAPSINATGRLETARIAVDALTADTDRTSTLYSAMMVYYNDIRKDMKYQMINETRDEVDTTKPVLVIRHAIHEGLVGIIAGNWAEEYNRPCFVFAPMLIDGETKAWKGSARSPEGCNWDCFENLQKVQRETKSILKFGGHSGAAGLTVLDSKFKVFEKALIATGTNIQTVSTESPSYDLEMSGTDFAELSIELQSLKPFGNGLPKPKIRTETKVWKIDLFFRTNHVKLSCSGGQEIWLYNELRRFLATYDLERYYSLTSTNVADKGEAEKWERWKIRGGADILWEIIAEYDFGPFMGNVGIIAGNPKVRMLLD